MRMKCLTKPMKIITNHKQIVNIAAFALCLLIGSLINLLTKDTLISEHENRTLAQYPQFQSEKFFNGEYTMEFEDYFADQFFSRELFVGISNDVKRLRGFPGAQEVQLVTVGGFNAFEEQAAVNPEEMGEGSELPGIESASQSEAGEQGVTEQQPMVSQNGLPGISPKGEQDPGETENTTLNNETSNTGIAGIGNEGSGTTDAGDGGNGTTGAGTPPTGTNSSAQPEAVAAGVGTQPTDANSPAKPETDTSPVNVDPTPASKPARDDNGKTINKVLIYKDSAYALFPFSEDSGNYYASTLNAFQKRVDEDVTVYSLLVPTNTEFVEEKKFRELSDSQKDTIEYVNARLKKVVPVDAYTPLEEHKNEYIYFKTDHHWTALGAYYAYTGFTQAVGLEPVPLKEYETETIKGYVGSMYETTGSSNLKRNPDIITVYKPFIKNEYNVYYGSAIKMNVIDMSNADKSTKYRVFLSGDRPLGVIKTEVTNGRKILVIKDSYGNAMVPFLLPHYEEIYVVDPRQYEKNIFELIEKNGIHQVLFLNYVPILSYYGYIDLIVKVMEAES